MKTLRWLLVFVPLCVSGCLCGVPGELAFCERDTDCAAGQRCSDGLCEPNTDCIPATACPEHACGAIDAGCGQSLQCSCGEGERCGAGGQPNLCAPCDPNAPDLPDDFFLDTDCDGIDGKADASIFVSPVGSDSTGDGGRDAPLRSISVALSHASGRAVLLDEGAYPVDGLVLGGETALHGGYRADAGWARDQAALPLLSAGSSGVRVEAADASVQLDRCRIVAADADGGAGGFSTAMVVLQSSDVTLHHCVLEAGQGANGGAGATGAQGTSGGKGGQGTAGSDNGSTNGGVGQGGSAGVNVDCAEANGGDGGNGGAGLSVTSQGPGAPGLKNAAGTANGGEGGAATCTSCGCANGDGGVGVDGPAGGVGQSGAGGSGLGSFSFVDGGVYLPQVAGAGGRGGTGGGGGGGGGGASGFVTVAGTCALGVTPTGGGGGGGGAGGCGGAGGAGGVGGGPSIALIVLQSRVNLEGSVLRTAGGGNGGEGGRGGAGGPGGEGGPGGPGGVSNGTTIAGSGGNGGRGGEGGRGGAGGGGVGGYSLGVYCEGAQVELADAGTALGPAGRGGVSTGLSGNPGQSAVTLGCQ